MSTKNEAANERADELQSRLDTVTASHCEMLRELHAERHRVDRLAELVKSAFLIAHDCGVFDARNNIHVTKETHWSVSEIRDELSTIMEGRDNG